MLTNIPEQKRINLPRIMKQLGMTQKDIASELKLTAGAISKYLAVGTGHARLRPERILRLVEVLRRRLTDCQASALLSEEQKSGSSGLIALPLLSPAAIQALEAEIDDLLAGDEVVELLEGPVLALPTGPLPINAMNYVSRAADAEVDEILATRRSPSSIVIAPINGGVSSFLNRVYLKARAVQNCQTNIVHLDTAFADHEEFNQLDLFRYLFRKIGVPGDRLEGNVDSMKDAFGNWARDKWAKASLVVFIVDGLDQIFKNAKSVVDPLALINWLGELRNETVLGRPPYNKLILCAALSGKTWSSAHASPYASQASALNLNKFTELEVAQVFERLDIKSSYDVKEIHSLFHGHPFLTQLFAWAMYRGASQDEAWQAALDLDGSYETHWERMKSEILFLVRNDRPQSQEDQRPPLNDIFKMIIEVADPAGRPLDNDKRELWSTLGRDLRVFGLVDLGMIDGDASRPSLCKFYRHAIEREQATLVGHGYHASRTLRVS